MSDTPANEYENTKAVWYTDGGNYVIMHTQAMFCGGYNVYKFAEQTDSGYLAYLKLNDPTSFFATLEAAVEWLDSYRKENDNANR